MLHHLCTDLTHAVKPTPTHAHLSPYSSLKDPDEAKESELGGVSSAWLKTVSLRTAARMVSQKTNMHAYVFNVLR